MILGYRSIATSVFNGANILILRDWTLPIDALGLACFKSFDESVAKLKSDIEATKIAPAGETSITAVELETATEAARRALPERYRGSSDFYSIAIGPGHEIGRRYCWTNLPAWAHVHVETSAGQRCLVESTSPLSKGWRALPLENEDLFVHISLFSSEFDLRLVGSDRPRFTRLSRVVEESEDPTLATVLTVAVFPQDLV